MAWIGRTHVTGYIINSTENISDRTMIHELTHVWQYVTDGLIYIPEAIDGQSSDEGYDFGGVSGLEATMIAGGGMSSYNREQQGEIVASYYDLIQQARTIEAGGGYASLSMRKDLDVYVHFVKEVSTLSVAELDALNPPIIVPPYIGDVTTGTVATRNTATPTPTTPATGGTKVSSTLALDAVYTQYSSQPTVKSGARTIAEEEQVKSAAIYKPVTTGDVDLVFAQFA
jgi:hypothetical protein